MSAPKKFACPDCAVVAEIAKVWLPATWHALLLRDGTEKQYDALIICPKCWPPWEIAITNLLRKNFA